MDLKRITDDFIGSINKGRKAKIILNKTAIEIKGGFILKTKHYEIDYTLDTIVKPAYDVNPKVKRHAAII